MASPFGALLEAFPPVSFAAAYGSGVFSQGTASDRDPSKLLDLLLAVDDPVQWHEANLTRHASHYPWTLRMAGASAVARLQLWGGAHMIFLPFAQVGNVRCKYGVISTTDLVRDLTHWDTLYCSGRLHKPVKLLAVRDPGTDAALRLNVHNALRVSLLHLSDGADRSDAPIAEPALYRRIASLSYAGDVRMGFAEDPAKVDNIVSNNLDRFRALYQPAMDDLCRARVLQRHADGATAVTDVAALRAMVPPHWRDPQHLAGIVRRVSVAQAAKGVISAGPARSFVYALRKVAKRFR